jgi:hypothetical protein
MVLKVPKDVAARISLECQLHQVIAIGQTQPAGSCQWPSSNTYCHQLNINRESYPVLVLVPNFK